MKILSGSIAYIALLATIVPAVLVFFGAIELEIHKNIMTVGMILWFVTAPLYMNKKKPE